MFTLDSRKFALHVENDTVTAIELSYEFDSYPCVAFTGHGYTNLSDVIISVQKDSFMISLLENC